MASAASRNRASPGAVGARDILQHVGGGCRIGGDAGKAERGIAFKLHGAGSRHAGGDLFAAFGRRRQDQVGGGDSRHLDVEIDAVEQRARQPGLVFDGAARVRGRGGR